MATGPEHYREAERLLAAVTHQGNLEPGDHADTLALAQVHATLAVAAATALSHSPEHMTIADGTAWFNAASTKD